MSFLIFLRSLISAALFVVITILLACLGICLNIIFNSRTIDNWIITTWGKQSCWLFGVRVHLHGLEKMPAKQGAIILFNHSSFIDVIAMAGYLSGVRFGAKIELFNIPIFSLAMKRFGTLPISRSNREEVFKVYNEAKPRFARGEKFALSPEGGRFFGPELSRFKSGPFVFAINAGVPVVPVVIHNAFAAWPKEALLPNTKAWITHVDINVLEAIKTTPFTVDSRDGLMNLVYTVMNSNWQNKPTR